MDILESQMIPKIPRWEEAGEWDEPAFDIQKRGQGQDDALVQTCHW